MEKIYSTAEVAALCGCAIETVQAWARKNDVASMGESRHKVWLWTDADIARFKLRAKPGKRAKTK
jgi:phage terminase Nu1 subunit (DNA packaging protein)